MDIKPEIMLTIAAAGALAYTCINKKKNVIPLVGGKKTKKYQLQKSAVGKCGRGKRNGFRCTGISRSKPSICKRWKRDSKCKKSVKKSNPRRKSKKSRKSKPKRKHN